MKKILIVLALIGLTACQRNMRATRVGAEEADARLSIITDEWVSTDTEIAITAMINQIETSRPLNRFLREHGGRPVIFVGEIQNATAEPYFPIADFNERLLTAIFNLGDFRVVDRDARAAILAEIVYQNDGMVDPAQARQIGRQTGAEVAVFGAIRMQPHSLRGRTVREYSVNLRITELETSDVVFMGTYNIQKASVQRRLGL